MTAARDIGLVQRSGGFVHYRGRPPWLTEAVLRDLNTESARLQQAGGPGGRRTYAPAGPHGLGLARSAGPLDLIAAHVAPAKPSGSANYLYYDRRRPGIEPHIDGPEFPLQILLMLRHTGYAERRSCLVVFPSGPEHPVPVILDPGELVLFSAASVWHGRTNVGAAESLTVLGIGYQLAGPAAG